MVTEMPPKNRKLNALKHGIFSTSVVLPGESQAEFDELHQSLIEEWEPRNLIESDAVLGMAKAVWRKRQLVVLRAAALRKKMKVSAETAMLTDNDLACTRFR